MMKLASALAVLALSQATALAQTKTDPSLETAFLDNERVRVIVVTRPDPYLPNGGASVAAPASYISAQLSNTALHVVQVASLPIVAAEIDASGLRKLQQDPNVALIAEDAPVPPVLFDSVALIGADKLHAAGIQGGTHTVAILDTGIEKDNAILTGDIVAQACFSTPQSSVYIVKSLCPNSLDVSLLVDAATGCPTDVTGCDHGTHVAGIVTGQQMTHDGKTFGGVSPGAKILPVQVFTHFEGVDVCITSQRCVLSFTSDQLRALDWLYKNRDKYKIASINMSLGSGYNDTHCDARSPLTQVIERLRSKGILTVVAAGNSAFFDGVAEPACISSTMSVSATDKSGNLDVTYSNVSTLADVAAPGTQIVSTVFGGGVRAATGTSMAAPHVAAAVALLKDMHPSATALELEAMLMANAPKVSDPRTNTTLARIDLGALAPATAASPPPDIVPTGWTETQQFGSRFIVQGAESEAGIAASLDATCKDITCTVKAIGGDQFLIEMKVTPEPGGEVVQGFSKEQLQDILSGPNSAIRVYSDKLAAPM